MVPSALSQVKDLLSFLCSLFSLVRATKPNFVLWASSGYSILQDLPLALTLLVPRVSFQRILDVF